MKDEKKYERQGVKNRKKHLFIVDEVKELNVVISKLKDLKNSIIGKGITPDEELKDSMPISLKDTLDNLPEIIKDKCSIIEILLKDISDILFVKE